MTRKHPVGTVARGARAWLARGFLIVAILLVLGATLLPSEPEAPIDWWDVICVLCGRAAVADGLVNVALFVPLGMALALVGQAPRRALLLAAGLSVLVELAQFEIPGRDPSLGDVIFDTLGAGLGGWLVPLAARWARADARLAGRLSLLAALAAGGVFALTAVLLTEALPETAYFGGSASVQSTDRPLQLGGNVEPRGYFQGSIDDVRVYRRARTASEIRDDMSSPVTPAARSADLVAAYNFDAGSGSEVSDISGNGHTGRIRGATWTDRGRFGGALGFDGVGSVVVIPAGPSLDLRDAMTLEAWIYPTAAQTGWRAVLQKDFDAYFLLAGSRSGALRPGGGATFGASTETMTAPAVVPTNAWTHVALTCEGALLQLYIDGRLVMRRLRWYPGRVISATVDGLEVPSGLITEWRRLRERLLAGAPLRVQAIAAAAVPTELPLVTLHDASRNEILLLAVEGDDVIIRLRTRAAGAGLDSPALRAPGLMRGLVPGDPFAVVVSRPGRRYCVGVDTRLTCGLGFTAGMGWSFVAYSQIRSEWAHRVLNLLWVAALLAPFGFWLRRRWESLLGGIVLLSAIVLPFAFRSLDVAPLEVAAAVGGVAVGRMLGRAHAGFAGSAQKSRSCQGS